MIVAQDNGRRWAEQRCRDPGASRKRSRYAPAGTFAVSSMPSAFITASVVFNVGLPFSLNERYSCSRDSPVCPAICAMPFARHHTERMRDVAGVVGLERLRHEKRHCFVRGEVFRRIVSGQFFSHFRYTKHLIRIHRRDVWPL